MKLSSRPHLRRVARRLIQVMAGLGYAVLLMFTSFYFIGYFAGGMSFAQTTKQLDSMSPKEVRGGLEQLFFAPKPLEPTVVVPVGAEKGREVQWQQDLDYLSENIERLHAIAWRYTTPANFKVACNTLKKQILEKDDYQLTCEINRILATLGDAHTGVNTMLTSSALRRSPFQVRHFADGYFITQTTPEQAALLGARITHVGTHASDDAAKKLKPWMSAENRLTDVVNVQNCLQMPDYLQAAGLIDNAEKLPLAIVDASGVARRVEIEIKHTARLQPQATVTPKELPLYLQQRDKNYWFRAFAEENAFYLKYNSCSDRDAFKAIAKEMLEAIDKMPSPRVIVDFRGNGGGDSSIFRPFLQGLAERKYNTRGKLIVLTDRHTFSSAFFNSLDLLKLKAVHLGEAPSQKLNYGGNIRSFLLPNSRLRINYPTQDSAHWPGVDIRTVEPEIEIIPLYADHAAARDPVLARALVGKFNE
jgi:hypothetical protein